MKFTRGYWLNKPGVENYDCVQIREIRVEDGRVYLYSVPYPQDERGMGGPVLEMVISSPGPDIIRTEAWHFMGSAKKVPEFELDIRETPLETEEFEGGIRVKSGETSLEITCRPAGFTYYYKGKKLTNVGDKFGHSMISYMHTPEGPFMRAQLDLDIGEKIYGLGERFTPFVKNGQVVDLWQEDGGTCSEISYKNIPFYLTNRGYGVFVNSSGPVSYELCSEVVTRAQFSVPGEKLDFMIIGGGDPKTVLHNYTAMTGRPALPPAWTFGLWLSTSFTTNYDEGTVNEFVNGMESRDIPLHVFHFDCYWMAENEWCNFTFDPKMFKDAPGMLKRLKERGLRICVWINSYIGQKSPLFKEAMEKGYLLKRPNGDVWQWDLWQAGMGLVDFTNPDATRWYQEKLKALLDMGVDCFKTDFGERIPVRDVAYFDGSDPVKMHNFYAYLYNKAVFDLLVKERGEGEACLFARSAAAGGQAFPVHWGGDCAATYESMAESLRGGLSLALCGFGFWSHDISGFEATATPDLYKRWAQFGLLSTHSRLHGSQSYRVPWNFDDEASLVVSRFTKLKCRLMPYLFAMAVKAHRTGLPVMRPMVLAFPEDRACHPLDTQYMLGDHLLAAPIFNDRGECEYYLPKGRWTNILTGETLEGGRFVTGTFDYFSLPLLAGPNSVIPMGSTDNRPDYDYGDALTFALYHIADGAEIDTPVYSQTGSLLFTAHTSRRGNVVTVTADGGKGNWMVSCEGQTVKVEGNRAVIEV